MYSDERLNAIFKKTDGYCHLCHKKLAFKNYNSKGEKGCWNVEHSVPKAKGGTDHLNNLFPACISCNHEKGTTHTKTVRANNGVTRAPLSLVKKKQIKSNNTIASGALGFIAGASIGIPVLGLLAGCWVGNKISPRK